MSWRKPTFQDQYLGTLSFSRGHWLSQSLSTSAGNVLISLEGDSASPGNTGLSNARELLADPGAVVDTAMAYVKACAPAREFMEGHGHLVLDGFAFKSTAGAFDVDLTLSDWPDAMITVVFRNGLPCGVLLSD